MTDYGIMFQHTSNSMRFSTNSHQNCSVLFNYVVLPKTYYSKFLRTTKKAYLDSDADYNSNKEFVETDRFLKSQFDTGVLACVTTG